MLLLTFLSCKKDKVDGIVIGNTLLENQSLSENRRLETLITSTLNGDYNSLRKLNNFPCDSAGCYDLGYVITQIIYKMGEPTFNKMIDKLDEKEIGSISGYIAVGLEYGDNNHDGKMDDKKSENEFPILMKKLSEK